MLQPIRIPISIFIALIPSIAASQIHSDEPQTCAIPSVELATPARSETAPALAHRDAKTNRESGADKCKAKERDGIAMSKA